LRPKNCVVDATTIEGQPAETVTKEELGKTSRDTLEEGEEDEHSKEWLKNFSQVAETKTPATLEDVTEEEHLDKMLTPWEMELEMLEDWLNHPEPLDECHEDTVMQMIIEEHSKESLRISSQGAEQMITAVSRRATEDEGKFQSEEQLEEDRIQLAHGEMVEASLSEKMTEQ
jgi:hypothetical protein